MVFTNKSFCKVKDYINNLCEENSDIKSVFVSLEELGDLIIIGGAIRDIGVMNINPRDIDIIIDTDYGEVLESIFKGYRYTRNRFGGFKLLLDKMELDIWSIDNNWAFKNKFLETKAEKIKDGIFYNIDSIVLNLSKDYYEAFYFNEAVRNKKLDIILDEKLISKNPSKSTNILRAFLLKEKYDLDFSERLVEYILEWVNNSSYPFLEIKKAYEKHYRKSFDSKSIYDDFYENLKSFV